MYIYIEESIVVAIPPISAKLLVQASLKRRVESEPVAVYLRRSGARGRGTRRGERGGDVERDTGPECLFSNEDGTGRFGSGSIRWTQH